MRELAMMFDGGKDDGHVVSAQTRFKLHERCSDTYGGGPPLLQARVACTGLYWRRKKRGRRVSVTRRGEGGDRPV